MQNEIIDILMRRDEIPFEEAKALVIEARRRVLEDGENPEDVLQEDFGLEPDFLYDLLDDSI